MEPNDRRADDEWRGEINARLGAVERRLEQMDAKSNDLGDDITGIRLDMSAMRGLVEQTAAIVKTNTEAREKERSEFIDDLQKTLAGKRAMPLTWALAIIGPLIATVVAALILLLITGSGH